MSTGANAEQLVNYIKEKVGDLACTFLLAGYGQQEAASRRFFVLVVGENAGGTREWHLEVTADVGYLPYDQDPLVLAAILKTLFDGQEKRVVTLTQPELLRLLGWDNTVETRKTLGDAILRYFYSSYVAKKMRVGKGGKLYPESITEGRLINRYDSVEAETELHAYMRVGFNERFIEQLRRASLFGIDWGRVTSFSNQI